MTENKWIIRSQTTTLSKNAFIVISWSKDFDVARLKLIWLLFSTSFNVQLVHYLKKLSTIFFFFNNCFWTYFDLQLLIKFSIKEMTHLQNAYSVRNYFFLNAYCLNTLRLLWWSRTTEVVINVSCCKSAQYMNLKENKKTRRCAKWPQRGTKHQRCHIQTTDLLNVI